MIKIRFSHQYFKMPTEDRTPNTTPKAKLLEVLLTNKNELYKDFIDYDTAFLECISKTEQKYHKGHYPLPDGKLIILLLLTTNSSGTHLWTTIRRWAPAKEQYYKSIRGKEIEIIISRG